MSDHSNIVTLTDFFTSNYDGDGYHYAVYHKDDDLRKKKLYSGRIRTDGSPIDCTCTGWSILKKCYHLDEAKKIVEIAIV